MYHWERLGNIKQTGKQEKDISCNICHEGKQQGTETEPVCTHAHAGVDGGGGGPSFWRNMIRSEEKNQSIYKIRGNNMVVAG